MEIKAKKLIIVLSMILSIVGIFSPHIKGDVTRSEIAAENDDRWRVTVFNFEVLDVEEANLDMKAREWLKTRLQQSGRLNLVDPEEAADMIGREIDMGDLIDPEKRTEIGNLLGWEVAIQGRIMGYGNSVDVNASLMEIQTGRLVQMIEVTGNDQSAEIIKGLVDKLAIEIEDFIPLRGEVLEIRKDAALDKQIVLDKGGSYGMKEGMRFEVYFTRAISGGKREEVKLAEIEATQVQEEISFAKVVSQPEGTPLEIRMAIEKGNKFRAIRNLGQLEIYTEPPGASISLGKNLLTGFSTPAKINLYPRSYDIELSKPGYEAYRSSVNIESYKTVNVNISLIPMNISIESPPDKIYERESYPLVIRDHNGKVLLPDDFQLLPLPKGLEKIMDKSENIIVKADSTNQNLKLKIEALWNENDNISTFKEITVFPKTGIRNWMTEHKLITATGIATVAAVGTVIVYKITRDDEPKEGNVEFTFTF